MPQKPSSSKVSGVLNFQALPAILNIYSRGLLISSKHVSIFICFSIKLMNLIALQQIHQNNDSIQSQEMVATELHLVRTILERLECAYAIQEAKLDRLLNMMPNAPAVLQQPLQLQPSFPPTQSSTPIQSNIPQSNSSVEYRAPETGSSALPVIQRFLHDTSTSVNPL